MLNVENVTVAGRLKVSRFAVGLDQSQMAALLGVSRTTVSSWERGMTEPNVSQFIGWARITKQPVDQLIDGLPGCTPRDLNPEPTD
ncbi:helix-turn-helix transcriptional regulator [Microbacterium esteraromaticum]